MKKLGISLIMAAALFVNSAAALPLKLNLEKLSVNPELYEFNPDLRVTFETATTGFGIGLESRLNSYLGIRTAFDWVPHFEFPMQFTIQVGKDGKQDSESRSRFNRMAGYLEDMTGFKIDQYVDMIGEPNFYNFKLLVDVYPFQNKKWYFTAGFYAGPSVIGRAYNRTEDMTTLMCVAMYNTIYDKIYDIEYNPYDTELNGVFMGMELPTQINERILEAGRMGMFVGEYKDQTDTDGKPVPYIMEPDQDNMVKAEMKVNSFRPYLGAGYNGLIDKRNERLKFAVDCGLLFWGGTPKVYTHDGTEIVSGLDNIIGQVGKYVDLVKPMKVFPVINISVSYTLFK
jgi:hypothetical protein